MQCFRRLGRSGPTAPPVVTRSRLAGAHPEDADLITTVQAMRAGSS